MYIKYQTFFICIKTPARSEKIRLTSLPLSLIQMTVLDMKSTVIEFQMAAVIKPLAEKYLFHARERERKRENYKREKEWDKKLEREKGRKEREREKERGQIKSLFCVELETHFLVRG